MHVFLKLTGPADRRSLSACLSLFRSTSDTMSASYHEIFDTQMPPETASIHLAQMALNSEAEEEEAASEALDAAAEKVALGASSDRRQLPSGNTADTTKVS